MKYLIQTFVILISMFTMLGQAQTSPCKCPSTIYAGNEPETSFQFANGKTIVLCGWKHPDSDPITYSEFVLAVCGQDTIIDFWEAVLTCRLEMNGDTLCIKLLENLPTGEDFAYEKTAWIIEKIFFNEEKITRKYSLNRTELTYNSEEIDAVLKEYELTKEGLNDRRMDLARKLCLASISGNMSAKNYFKEFKLKFGPLDGAFAEEYKDLQAILRKYKMKK